MAKIFCVAVSLAALACGNGPASNQTTFELVVPDAAIELEGGETRVIQLLVLGAGAEPVSVSGEFPAFATLEGDLLTLAPSRADLGYHAIKLVATASARTARATLAVTVTRNNTWPSWDYFVMSDDVGLYLPGWCSAPDRSDCCPGLTCLLGSSPLLHAVGLCDAESDEITIEFEFVPLGQPFTGVPTFTRTARPAFDSFSRCGEGCICVDVPLDSFSPGTRYAFSARTYDEWGATMPCCSDCEGWCNQPYMQFEIRP
jgi:hypothetical protein